MTTGVDRHGPVNRVKVMDVLAEVTGGISYKAHKYGLDHADRPSVDYGDSEIVWKRRAETTQHRTYVDLEVYLSRISSGNDQILTHFLDGSRRVFKVDDIAYRKSGGRSVIYPVVAGQIGVACCQRVNKKLIKVASVREFVLSMPDIADADGGKRGFWEATARKISDCSELRRLNIEFSTILPYKTAGADSKYEDLATACIQDRMARKEKDLVAELVRQGRLNQDNYLVKDGSLQYKPSADERSDRRKYQIFKNNFRWVIGVSKNFNPEVCEDINGKPNPGFIAELPLFHRTPVAEYENPLIGDAKIAVWYLRLRDRMVTRTPFDGILKVEKILVTDEEIDQGIDSELVDTLSAYLLNERNPVCYGSDLRWANHIYPIYLTESYVKSLYLSSESFLHLF